MNKVDLSKKIMERVVRFEKRRATTWILKFAIVTLIFALGFLGALWIVARQLIENDTLSLLTLFENDKEIIQEFWKESIQTFWEETPQAEVVFAIILLVTTLSFLFVFRKKLKIVIKRLTTLAKYRKSV